MCHLVDFNVKKSFASDCTFRFLRGILTPYSLRTLNFDDFMFVKYLRFWLSRTLTLIPLRHKKQSLDMLVTP